MRTLENALSERTREPAFRAEYEALEPEFAIIQAIVDARKQTSPAKKEAKIRKSRRTCLTHT